METFAHILSLYLLYTSFLNPLKTEKVAIRQIEAMTSVAEINGRQIENIILSFSNYGCEVAIGEEIYYNDSGNLLVKSDLTLD